MSFEGRLIRGMKWHNFRDRDGNYPKGIKDTERELDLEEYLKFIEGKDQQKVGNMLKEISLMARSAQKKLPKYKKILEELKNLYTSKDSKKKEA